ncbi:MAG: class I SAM-dependent methyltransferase [Acidobacteriota bacterium]|nr:class I SAM-dependent methyltransferase [Acidobacteriota bacterium]
MAIAILYPSVELTSIDERYASWKAQTLLRRGTGISALLFYRPDERASDAAADIDDEYVLVITDPLIVPPPNLAQHLVALLQQSGAAAAVPKSSTSEPGAYACRTDMLDTIREPLAKAIAGREVVVSETDVPGHARPAIDLLPFIPGDARNLLHIHCGDGSLGAAVKARQKCRFAGIEEESPVTAIARRRIDELYTGDVREIVPILEEQFDCIIAADVLRHTREPWLLLSELRRISARGRQLILTVPNAANASLIHGLLHGRIEGLPGALFTRSSIVELLESTGWQVVGITPHGEQLSAEGEELLRLLGSNYALDDLRASSYIVTAASVSRRR